MNINELTNHIESIEYEILFSVLSGFKSVLSAMQIDETVKTLVQAINNNADQQRAILQRIQSLIPEYKSGYMHLHDIAITAYLFALNRVNSYDLLEMVTDKIIALPEFFWARKLAQIIQQNLSKSQASN